MQHDTTDQLLVEVAHVEDAPASLTDDGERFDQDVIERCALGEPFFKLNRPGGEIGVGELLDFRLQRVDGVDGGTYGFHIPLSLRAEDLRENCVYHKISISAAIAKFYSSAVYLSRISRWIKYGCFDQRRAALSPDPC